MHVRLEPEAELELGWWSPDPRGVIPLDGLVVSRSLRRSLRRYTVSVDTAFDAVVAGCADRSRSGGWITEEVETAYRRLHGLGWAHSVEVWDPAGALVGGLYGLCVGGLFAGESMFFRVPNASKVAFAHLVAQLDLIGTVLIDAQVPNPFTTQLGAVTMRRAHYLELLRSAVKVHSRYEGTLWPATPPPLSGLRG